MLNRRYLGEFMLTFLVMIFVWLFLLNLSLLSSNFFFLKDILIELSTFLESDFTDLRGDIFITSKSFISSQKLLH